MVNGTLVVPHSDQDGNSSASAHGPDIDSMQGIGEISDGERSWRDQLASFAFELEAKVAGMRQSIAKANAELEELLAVIRFLRLKAGTGLPSVLASEGSSAPAEASGGRRRSPGNSQSERIRRVAAAALRQEGRPLKRGDLHGYIVAAGIELPRDKPLQRVSRVMAEAGEFAGAKDGYWFKGEPRPAGA